ncbi:MAG: hypothetical protein ABW168_17935 [Sedimenticola sp.]
MSSTRRTAPSQNDTLQKQDEAQHTQINNYNLNRQNAIKKKIAGCSTEHIKYEVKPGKNLVISLSTAAYELSKQIITDILQSDTVKNQFTYTKETAKDLSDANVEMRYKIVNKKKDGHPGMLLKVTINFYNTTSRIMVNGNRTDFFVEHILPKLTDTIAKRCNDLVKANQQIGASLGVMYCEAEAEELKVKNRVYRQSHVTPLKCISLDQNNITMNTETDNNNTYICPICDTPAEDQTIGCDDCDGWFHYGCAGLNKEDIPKIGPDTPYICEQCNDNLLYTGNNQTQTISPVNNTGTTQMRLPSNTDMLSYSHSTDQTKLKTPDIDPQPLNADNTNKKTTNVKTTQKTTKNSTSNTNHDRTQVLYQQMNTSSTLTDQSTRENSDVTTRSDQQARPDKLPSTSHQQQSDDGISVIKSVPGTCDSLSTQSTNINTQEHKTEQTKAKNARVNQTTAKKHETETKKIELEQKKYINELEKKVVELEKTVNLINKRKTMTHTVNETEQSSQSVNMGHTNQTENTYTHVHKFDNTVHQDLRNIELQTMEMRIRQLEMNSMQHLALATTQFSQLTLQMQQQANMVTSIQLQQAYNVPQQQYIPSNPYLMQNGYHHLRQQHMMNPYMQPTMNPHTQPFNYLPGAVPLHTTVHGPFTYNIPHVAPPPNVHVPHNLQGLNRPESLYDPNCQPQYYRAQRVHQRAPDQPSSRRRHVAPRFMRAEDPAPVQDTVHIHTEVTTSETNTDVLSNQTTESQVEIPSQEVIIIDTPENITEETSNEDIEPAITETHNEDGNIQNPVIIDSSPKQTQIELNDTQEVESQQATIEKTELSPRQSFLRIPSLQRMPPEPILKEPTMSWGTTRL